MASSSIKRRVALKGLSRSRFCGEPIKAGSKTPCLRLSGHKGKHRPTTMRAAKQPPVVAVAEVAADGTIGAIVEPTVTVLPDAGAEGRDVQPVGRARRAKAAPVGTKSRSNAGALKGRIKAKA